MKPILLLFIVFPFIFQNSDSKNIDEGKKLFYDKGFLKSHSPSTYKIPNVQDTPRSFNIKLFNNNKNYASQPQPSSPKS